MYDLQSTHQRIAGYLVLLHGSNKREQGDLIGYSVYRGLLCCQEMQMVAPHLDSRVKTLAKSFYVLVGMQCCSNVLPLFLNCIPLIKCVVPIHEIVITNQ